MRTEFKIAYQSGWFFESFWLVFGADVFYLLDKNKLNGIEVKYENVYHVIKIPLSFTAILIACHENILKNYPLHKIEWFPPRPLNVNWVFDFTIHNRHRGDILENFKIHGVRTKLDIYTIDAYYKEIAEKSKLENKDPYKL